jgi:hypothetical protein
MIFRKPPIIIRRSIVCKTCDIGVTHLIGTYPNDDKADLTPGKERCGNCVERDLQNSIIKNAPTSERAKQIIRRRLEDTDRKATIKGYCDSVKIGGHKKWSYLFKSRGIKQTRSKISSW